MKQIAIQYLESCPELATRPVDAVRRRLRIAGEKLPISSILIGWHLAHHLLEACRQETAKLGAKFYRWHPLPSGDGTFYPLSEWKVIGLKGEPIAGFQGMPEFTFVCPNRPAAAEAVLRRVDEIISNGDYDGVFLDRIRFPSPASNPAATLSCFCESCQQAAAQKGLDLAEIRTALQEWVKKPSGRCDLVRLLLKPPETRPDSQQAQALQTFIKFRSESITAFVSKVVDQFHANGLLVGLDCFSPMLAPMVGQDLSALGKPVDWVKLAKGLTAVVNYNLRLYPLCQEARTRLPSGEVGEVYLVHGGYLQDWLFLPNDWNWRLDAEAGSSRIVADIGTHWLDLITWLTGYEVVEVMADMTTVIKTRYKPLHDMETFSSKLVKAEDTPQLKSRLRIALCSCCVSITGRVAP